MILHELVQKNATEGTHQATDFIVEVIACGVDDQRILKGLVANPKIALAISIRFAKVCYSGIIAGITILW